LVGSFGFSRDFYPTLAALVGPLTHIFFLTETVHYYRLLVSIAQQAGQAVVPRLLSLNMCHLAYDPDRVSNAEAKAIETWS
jgi:hypothetical protein